MRIDVELSGQSFDGVEGKVTLCAFDPREITGCHVELFGEGFLCEVATLTLGAQIRAERQS